MSAEQLAQRILAEQSTIDSHRLRSGDINDDDRVNIEDLILTINMILGQCISQTSAIFSLTVSLILITLSSMRIAVVTVAFIFSSSNFPSNICCLRFTEPRLQTAISSPATVLSVISVQRLDE